MMCTGGGEGEIFFAGEGDGRVTGGGRRERSAEEKKEWKIPWRFWDYLTAGTHGYVVLVTTVYMVYSVTTGAKTAQDL